MHGFIFGKIGDKYLTKKEDTDGHILVVGGAGSGKTTCLAIPSLRAWRERVFCLDIKGDLWEHTNNYRSNVKKFAPLEESSFGYDPFCVLKKSHSVAQEVEAISMALVPLPENIQDPFWGQSARNWLTGVLLHFYNHGVSFMDAIIKLQSSNPRELINKIYKDSKSEEARIYLNAIVYMENKALTSVYAELSRHLMPFATDSNIKKSLANKETITPEDLENGTDIYICIPEYLLRQWKNLVNLIVSQFIRHFEKRPDRNAKPILFLLDEFPRIGKIEVITDAFATLRSKNITLCPIIQSLAQLDLHYGHATRRVIVDNCQYKAILNATEAESQKYFSDLLGTHEKEKISTNIQRSPVLQIKSGTGESRTTEDKPKIKPEDFAYLGDKMVALTPFGDFMVEKMPYYK